MQKTLATYDVTLPASQSIVFPCRCVVCEAENPDAVVKLSILGAKATPLLQMAADKALYGDVDPKYYGGNTLNTIEGVPACKRCASGLKRYHILLKVGYYTAWIPGVGLIVAGVPQIISVPFLIACAVSPGVFTLIVPPAFGATFYNDQANFEFKSQRLAEEFLQLNSEATSKSARKNSS